MEVGDIVVIFEDGVMTAVAVADAKYEVPQKEVLSEIGTTG